MRSVVRSGHVARAVTAAARGATTSEVPANTDAVNTAEATSTASMPEPIRSGVVASRRVKSWTLTAKTHSTLGLTRAQPR